MLACVSLGLLLWWNLQDSRYDPIPEFESLLSRFPEKPRTEEILMQMGSYHLFIKNDLTTAYRQYWSKVILENPDSEKLKVCNISNSSQLHIYVCVCVRARAYFRSQQRALFHLLFWFAIVTLGCRWNFVWQSSWSPLCINMKPSSHITRILSFSQGSKLLYFPLRIQD